MSYGPRGIIKHAEKVQTLRGAEPHGNHRIICKSPSDPPLFRKKLRNNEGSMNPTGKQETDGPQAREKRDKQQGARTAKVRPQNGRLIPQGKGKGCSKVEEACTL